MCAFYPPFFISWNNACLTLARLRVITPKGVSVMMVRAIDKNGNSPVEDRIRAERLRIIAGAIEEIAGRPDLTPEEKARGIQALKKAQARAMGRKR